MLSVRHPVNIRLLVVKFLQESKVVHKFSTVQGSAPQSNPWIVQESTVLCFENNTSDYL